MQLNKQTVLIFPNLQLLWAFTQTLKKNYLEINTPTKTLICDCSEVDVAKAVAEYKAKVMPMFETRVK